MKTLETHQKEIIARAQAQAAAKRVASVVGSILDSEILQFSEKDKPFAEIEFKLNLSKPSAAALENQMNIDNLATQTPEEKEALDLIDTTPHQYEMSKLTQRGYSVGKVLKAIDDLGKFNDASKLKQTPLHRAGSASKWVEWVNGDKCIYQGKEWQFVSILSEYFHSTAVLFNVDTEELKQVPADSLSKPETPQQREERERLEAADAMGMPDIEAWFWELDSVEMKGEYRMLTKQKLSKLIYEFKLELVKSGYRKESN